MRERRGDTASEGAMRARRDGSEHETTRRFCVRAFVDSPSPPAGTLLPPSSATHAARRNASGASLKSFTVPSPPHVSAPPRARRSWIPPPATRFFPPLGAMNVCRSCAARTCCRCLPRARPRAHVPVFTPGHEHGPDAVHASTLRRRTHDRQRFDRGGVAVCVATRAPHHRGGAVAAEHAKIERGEIPRSSRGGQHRPRRPSERRPRQDAHRRCAPLVRRQRPRGGARRRREGIPQRQRIPRAGEFRPRRRHHRGDKNSNASTRVPLVGARRRGVARGPSAVRAPRRHHTVRRADRESSAPGTPRHRRDRRRRVGRRFVGRTGDCFDVSRFRRRVRPNRPVSRSGRGDDARATVLGGVRCETPQHGGSGRRPREHDRLFRVRLDASSDDVAGGGRGERPRPERHLGGGVGSLGGGPIVETRRAGRRRSNRRGRAPRFRAPRFLGHGGARETRPTVRPTTTRPLAGGAPPGAPRSRSPPRVHPALASPRRRPDGVNPRRRDPSSPPRGRVDRAPPG